MIKTLLWPRCFVLFYFFKESKNLSQLTGASLADAKVDSVSQD